MSDPLNKCGRCGKEFSEAALEEHLCPIDEISTKKCVECKKDIPVNANRCFHCKAYQDWRRHVTFLHVFFGLVLTMLTIWTVIIFLTGGTEPNGNPPDYKAAEDSKRTDNEEPEVAPVSNVEIAFEDTVKIVLKETTFRSMSKWLVDHMEIDVILKNDGKLDGLVEGIEFTFSISADRDLRFSGEANLKGTGNLRGSVVSGAFDQKRIELKFNTISSEKLQYFQNTLLENFAIKNGPNPNVPHNKAMLDYFCENAQIEIITQFKNHGDRVSTKIVIPVTKFEHTLN